MFGRPPVPVVVLVACAAGSSLAAAEIPCADYKLRTEVTDYLSLSCGCVPHMAQRGDSLYILGSARVIEVAINGTGNLALRRQVPMAIAATQIVEDSGLLYVMGADFLGALAPSLGVGPTAPLPATALDFVVDGSFAYAVTSVGTLEVVDVSNPLNPQVVQSLSPPFLPLAITQSDTHLYLTGGTTSQKCDVMVYAKDPVNGPQFVTAHGAGPLTYGDVFSHAAYANGTVYVAHQGMYDGTIHEVDVTDPAYPVTTGEVSDYLGFGEIFGIDGLLADDSAAWAFTSTGVLVVDPSAGTVGSLRPYRTDALVLGDGWMWVANDDALQAVRVVETATIPAEVVDMVSAIPYSGALDCAGLVVDGDYGYTLTEGAEYLEGPDFWKIRKQDLTAPPPHSWSVRTALAGDAKAIDVDGMYAAVVTDVSPDGGLTGLLAFQSVDDLAPIARGTLALPEVEDVAVSGSTAYVTSATQGIQIADMTLNPPTFVGALPTAGATGEAVQDGGRLYVLDLATPALRIYDLSAPLAPPLLGTAILPALPDQLAVDGAIAVVTEPGGTVVRILDVGTPSAPVIAGSLDTGLTLGPVAIGGTTAYAGFEEFGADGDENHGDLVIDVSDPATPYVREQRWVDAISGLVPYQRETCDLAVALGHVYSMTHHQSGWAAVWLAHLPEQCAVATAAPASVPTAGTGITVSPSPFRAETWIRLAVPRATVVRIGVHDVAGRRVRDLGSRSLPPGAHGLRWDGNDDSGAPAAAGIYFVSVEGVPGGVAKVVRLR